MQIESAIEGVSDGHGEYVAGEVTRLKNLGLGSRACVVRRKERSESPDGVVAQVSKVSNVLNSVD
jgi:hypothetical protein